MKVGWRAWLCVGGPAVFLACGSSSNGGGDLSSAPNGSFANSGSENGNGGPNAGGSGASAEVLPAETKTESNYQSPVSTGKFIWIANPVSGRVAYIDAQTFSVQTIQAGDGPTYVAAVPDPVDDVAIVQNVISQDATLLRNHQGVLQTPKRFPSTADANAWAVSPSGRWAIAWTDASLVNDPDPTQGFQDLAVIDTTLARPATILAVGYRPVQIAFSKDDARAFAVTQDGITAIDLTGGAQPTVTDNYPLVAVAADAGAPEAGDPDSGSGDASADAPPADAGVDATTDAGSDAGVDTGAVIATPTSPVSPAGSGTPDVSFTPDGAYALARNNGLSSIDVIALATGQSIAVNLPAAPTDLTVSPEGDFAVAVLRDIATVAILPLPGVVTDPTSVSLIALPGQTVGRAIVPAGGKSVLLFTTAAAVDALVILTPKPTPQYRVVTLHAPVTAVFPTADAQNAVVLHDVQPDGGPDKGAFSLVPIGAVTLPAKIVSLPAAPTAVALAPTSDRALVSMRDDPSQTYGLDLAMLPSFEVTSYTLASPPIAVGMAFGPVTAPDAGSLGDAGASFVPRGYVAQDYPEGRITFVDLSDGSPRTITGFELGASITGGGN